jgi:hypothetical protein
MNFELFLAESAVVIKGILIASGGGVANYLSVVRKGEKFRFSVFTINVVLAGFVGYLLSGMVDSDSSMY